MPDNDTVVDDEPGEHTVDVLDGDSVISMLDDYFDSDSLVDVTENKKSQTVVQAIPSQPARLVHVLTRNVKNRKDTE